MSEKAPMPPWWVERREYFDGRIGYCIWGGRPKKPVPICEFMEGSNAGEFSNAKELADLIVQRTADAKN